MKPPAKNYAASWSSNPLNQADLPTDSPDEAMKEVLLAILGVVLTPVTVMGVGAGRNGGGYRNGNGGGATVGEEIGEKGAGDSGRRGIPESDRAGKVSEREIDLVACRATNDHGDGRNRRAECKVRRGGRRNRGLDGDDASAEADVLFGWLREAATREEG